MNEPLVTRLISAPKIMLFYFQTFFVPKTLSIFQVWQVKTANVRSFLLATIVRFIHSRFVSVFRILLV